MPEPPESRAIKDELKACRTKIHLQAVREKHRAAVRAMYKDPAQRVFAIQCSNLSLYVEHVLIPSSYDR